MEEDIEKLNQLHIEDEGQQAKTKQEHLNRRDSLAGVTFEPSGIYVPPRFALMHKDTDMPPPIIRDKLEVNEFPLHAISTAWIKIMTQGLSEWIKLPIIVCRGTEDG